MELVISHTLQNVIDRVDLGDPIYLRFVPPGVHFPEAKAPPAEGNCAFMEATGIPSYTDGAMRLTFSDVSSETSENMDPFQPSLTMDETLTMLGLLG